MKPWNCETLTLLKYTPALESRVIAIRACGGDHDRTGLAQSIGDFLRSLQRRDRGGVSVAELLDPESRSEASNL